MGSTQFYKPGNNQYYENPSAKHHEPYPHNSHKTQYDHHTHNMDTRKRMEQWSSWTTVLMVATLNILNTMVQEQRIISLVPSMRRKRVMVTY